MRTVRFVAGLAFLGLLTSVAGTAYAGTSPCGQGTIEEIEATPRPAPSVEALAMLLGPGITADSEIYNRMIQDLQRIWAQRPSLAGIEFQLYWGPTDLLVILEPEAFDDAQQGRYTAWDCLNDWYNVQEIDYYGIADLAVLRFEGLFHSDRIAPDYRALPGVKGVGSNTYDYAIPGPTLVDLCTAIDGAAYDYFLFEGSSGQFRTWYFRSPQAGAEPVEIGKVIPTDRQPVWWPRFLQCRNNLDIAAGGPREGW